MQKRKKIQTSIIIKIKNSNNNVKENNNKQKT